MSEDPVQVHEMLAAIFMLMAPAVIALGEVRRDLPPLAGVVDAPSQLARSGGVLLVLGRHRAPCPRALHPVVGRAGAAVAAVLGPAGVWRLGPCGGLPTRRRRTHGNVSRVAAYHPLEERGGT